MQLKDTSFVDLMLRRICNVLLVANPYDAFMLEDDGRIEEKIFAEYVRLGLRFPPRFIQVSTMDEAEEQMATGSIDLVICMPAMENNDVFTIARTIKSQHQDLPIVVLTPFSHGITARMQNEDLTAFDYVFCWLGNTELLLSIIKLIEDKMNIDHDIEQAGVQMIMLVEDSIRHYSSLLPILYKFVLQQSLAFATEALNATLETMRMRGRPKIVLVRNYEEAWQLYMRYKSNTLGVISDCSFPRQGEKDDLAGYKLLTAIREVDPYMPIILTSNEADNVQWADKCGASFVDKTSKKLDSDLRKYVRRYFGFGDFVFRDPQTLVEVARVRNLKELQDQIMTLPSDSLVYHIRHNNVSRWLASRALFPLSDFVKQLSWQGLPDLDAHRKLIHEAIIAYRRMKNQGVVAVFQRERFDQYSNFARIGEGSLGGKGRGLAFLDNILKRHPEFQQFEGVQVHIPKTVVLCTDIFDEFMDSNDLYTIALSDADDETVLHAFLESTLPPRLIEDLEAFMNVVGCPIAVRSSSLLEDAHYQPFAGVYSTYMVPYSQDNAKRLYNLTQAIKGVYASVFFRQSKDYMTATSSVIDQEKMAVILQEVIGQQYGERYYPTLSGVARSINYYPIEDERPEEGTVNLAMGLGKYIVDGGTALRVCPAHPQKVLQTSQMELALRDTQTSFLALNIQEDSPFQVHVDDGDNLLKVAVRNAEKDGSLRWISSTYDPQSQYIYDGYYPDVNNGFNRKIISFAGVLKNGVFPLPELMRMSLSEGEKAMQRAVEIEFAANIHEDRTGEFCLLQIRPMVDNRMDLGEDLQKVADERCLLRSHSAIGHGHITDVQDIVYVKTNDYKPSNNQQIAEEIEQINHRLLQDNTRYLLIGPGRWGSSDPWLGVPVKWPHISSAQVIVELGLDNYRVDPSQGTHFFQNLTSLGVSYMRVDSYGSEGGFIRMDELDALPAIEETEHVRHVRMPMPLDIKVDGMHQECVVMR